MNTTGSIITILLGGFTGWAITWIAAKMFFYPKQQTRFMGFTIQGIFPKNQQEIVEKFAGFVSREFLSSKHIEEKFTHPDNFQRLQPDIENHVDHFLRNKLPEVFPLLSKMMGEKTILQLKGAFLAELDLLFPVVMQTYLSQLQQEMDVEVIINEKVAGFPPGKIEQVLKTVMARELKRFTMMGVAIGLVTGIMQVIVLHLTRL